jgi:hypothetical protein
VTSATRFLSIPQRDGSSCGKVSTTNRITFPLFQYADPSTSDSSKLGGTPPEVFRQIIEHLPVDDLHRLSLTSTAFRRSLDPIVEHQLSELLPGLDREQAAPLVKRLVFQSPSPNACSAILRRICCAEKLSEEMFAWQKKRISFDETYTTENDWTELAATLKALPCIDADYPAFFAAASGNSKLLELLAKTGWMPFRGTLYFAVRWELGYRNPFIHESLTGKEEDVPIVSPAERVPGVVTTVLTTPMPPGIKHLMVVETVPTGFEPGIINGWNEESVLCFPSARPPDCTRAASILRQMLPLKHLVKDMCPRVKFDSPDAFSEAFIQLMNAPDKDPKVVLAWLETGYDLILQGTPAEPFRYHHKDPRNFIPIWPDWWPAFEKRDWTALGELIKAHLLP